MAETRPDLVSRQGFLSKPQPTRLGPDSAGRLRRYDLALLDYR